MKKIYFLCCLLLSFASSFAQNTFPASGNVGIGTSTPDVALTVNGGSIKVHDPGAYPLGYDLDLDYPGGWAREYGFSYQDTGKLFSLGAYGVGSTLNYGYIGGNTSANSSYANPWMVFLPTGDIGIGTKTPQSKLAVNGTVTAKQVKVTQSGWADFVFQRDYSVPSLDSIETYINQNSHLPGIPSQQEIADQGLDIGDMQKKQMQKIEELTLYVIELNKKQQVLEDEVEELKARNEKLTQRLNHSKSNQP